MMECITKLRPRVIPLLLLKGRGLVKGVSFKSHAYLGDPMNAVRIFNEKQVDELILLDITATAEGRRLDPDFVRGIAEECYMPFVVGGGIGSCADARKLLMAGAEKICVNSSAIERPALISELAGAFGRQSIVAAIDYARTWTGALRVFSRSGAKRTSMPPHEWAMKLQSLGAGEILLTDIDREGAMCGYGLDCIRMLSASLSVPLIASGGAGSVSDIQGAIDSGASAAAAGSLFLLHGPRRASLVSFPSQGELVSVYGKG